MDYILNNFPERLERLSDSIVAKQLWKYKATGRDEQRTAVL